MNLADYRRRMESAADGCDLRTALLIAGEVRSLGRDFEADLLLMVYGERSKVALDKLDAEVAR